MTKTVSALYDIPARMRKPGVLSDNGMEVPLLACPGVARRTRGPVRCHCDAVSFAGGKTRPSQGACGLNFPTKLNLSVIRLRISFR